VRWFEQVFCVGGKRRREWGTAGLHILDDFATRWQVAYNVYNHWRNGGDLQVGYVYRSVIPKRVTLTEEQIRDW
jgi:hypothetical protein